MSPPHQDETQPAVAAAVTTTLSTETMMTSTGLTTTKQEEDTNKEGAAGGEEETKEEEEEKKEDEDVDDEEWIRRADEHFSEERIRLAARCLRNVKDQTKLSDKRKEMFHLEEYCLEVIDELTSAPDAGWKKQGESHGDYNTIIYYKVNKENQLTCRIETPIDKEFVIPIISVFNESDLYRSWMPYFKRPFRMGVSHTEKLAQKGRCGQLIQVDSDMPFPFMNRQVLQDTYAFDDIDENGYIVVKVLSLQEGDVDISVGTIPPPPKGYKRVDFNGGVLFRPCPPDHPMVVNHQETPLLLGLTMQVDAHVSAVPLSLINFVTRTMIGKMWGNMVKVAEEVQAGERPQHQQAIASKRDLYDWVENRVRVMLDRV